MPTHDDVLMPRRRGPPRTAFGAWLDAWLSAHPEQTLAGFGSQVGVTKSAVSLWLSGESSRIPIERLRVIARVTGHPVENLERMVYPDTSVSTPSFTTGTVQWDADQAAAFAEQMRQVIQEAFDDHDSRQIPTTGSRVTSQNPGAQGFWIRMARKAKWPDQQKAVQALAANVKTDLLARRLDRIERGKIPATPAELEMLAEAFEVSRNLFDNPPPTIADVVGQHRLSRLAEARRRALDELDLPARKTA